MRKGLRFISLLLLAIIFTQADSVFADIFYNDPGAWSSAVSGSVATMNFEGIAPSGGATFVGSGAGANKTVSGVNFAIGSSSNGDLFIIGDNFYYPGTAAISTQQSTTPFNDLVIKLPRPTQALSFYYGDFFGDTPTITLSDGAVDNTETFTARPFLGFWGVTTYDSGAAITSVEISAPSTVFFTTPQGNAINVASVSFAAVPEPASLALLGIAALCVTLVYRKQLRQAAK